MLIEHKAGLVILIALGLLKILFAQDSLLHTEALSAHAMEEFEKDGRVSLKVSFSEEVQYKLKTQFAYRGFEFNYLDEGGDKEGEKTASLSWSSNWIEIGAGRGQPNIAKGLILGNTMMRFTPNLGNLAGMSPAKLKIKSYAYYKDLIFVRGSIRNFGAAVFRYNGYYCGFIQYRHNTWHAGAVVYGFEKSVLESWVNYRDNEFRSSLNASLAKGKLNHATADMYYSHGNLRLFMSAIYMHPEFIALKSDSKWGSGLQAGSQGYASGASLTFSPWKINCLGYCVLRNDYREQRFMLDLRYRKTPLELIISYSSKNISELKEREIFPFDLQWQEQLAGICKLNIKLQIFKQLHLSCQLQGDMINMGSYVSILRLTYKRPKDLLRLQISSCRSCGNALYFLRPLTASTYSIRRAPENETLYVDLVYSKDMGVITLYVLLRNEGVNVGFDYRL